MNQTLILNLISNLQNFPEGSTPSKVVRTDVLEQLYQAAAQAYQAGPEPGVVEQLRLAMENGAASRAATRSGCASHLLLRGEHLSVRYSGLKWYHEIHPDTGKTEDLAVEEFDEALARMLGITEPELKVFTVFCKQKGGGGTTWIGALKAKDEQAAASEGAQSCADDWGMFPEDVNVLGVAEGDVKIITWDYEA